MEQAILDRVWDRMSHGEPIERFVGRTSREHDYLIELPTGDLWHRSHEHGVWRATTPPASAGMDATTAH